MADKKKMSVAEILAAARKTDAGAGGAGSVPEAPAASESAPETIGTTRAEAHATAPESAQSESVAAAAREPAAEKSPAKAEKPAAQPKPVSAASKAGASKSRTHKKTR